MFDSWNALVDQANNDPEKAMKMINKARLNGQPPVDANHAPTEYSQLSSQAPGAPGTLAKKPTAATQARQAAINGRLKKTRKIVPADQAIDDPTK